jgi:Mg2+/Co2+ transporter CorB
LFAGLSAEAQKVIDNMSEEELANVISFYEQTKMPLGGILNLEDLPVDKNFVPRWRFQLGQPLVKP